MYFEVSIYLLRSTGIYPIYMYLSMLALEVTMSTKRGRLMPGPSAVPSPLDAPAVIDCEVH